jgi:hypothetical protein
MFSTNFYNDDDFFGYHRPQRQRYYYYPHHRHQRGPTIDDYYLHRQKEEEALEAAYAHRQRRELQERQLYERRRQQAMALRERELLERKRRAEHRSMMHQQQQLAEAHNDDDEDYEVDIVRGYDGNLYYIKRPVMPNLHNTKQQPSTITEETNYRSRRELRPNLVVEEEESDSDSESDNEYDKEKDSEWSTRRDAFNVSFPQRLEPQLHTRNRSSPRKKNPKRRITVTVEDASDSECESEFDSPWRNRRPSPGQWMEPVEPFYG